MMDLRNGFVISDVANHQEIKQKILSEIKEVGIHSSIVEGVSVSNTDWELHANYPRRYWRTVEPLFQDQNHKICALYNHEVRAILKNFWFQQYAFDDFHSWHLHESCLYSSVYYVELPEKGSRTTFKFLGQEFEMDVKEGQIISFPSILLHCSKPNKSQSTKTIISFNTDLVKA
jgi:hypothetical protein